MPDINEAWAKSIARYPERFGALSALFNELLDDFHWLGGDSAPYRERFKSINSDEKLGCTPPRDMP